MAAVELAIRQLDAPEVDGITYDEVIEAGEHLPGMAALWDEATVEERYEMVTIILEPGGLYYDLENKIIAAIKPRPAFLPVLRMLNEVMEFDETRGLLVTEHWCDRNRRATSHRSYLALIPLEKLFPGRNDILVYRHPTYCLADQPDFPFLPQRRPGPDNPQWKIPQSEWSTVLRRVEQNREPLRQVARDYGVSYEAVRRVVHAARKLQIKEL
jgi:hypothetical protein